MNKKNKRIREQIVDFLTSEFHLKVNWVREIDIVEHEDDDDNFLLDSNEKENVKLIIRNKLLTNQFIKLRIPLVGWFNDRKNKNLPAICLDIKINGCELKYSWKIADKFGTHYGLWEIQSRLENLHDIINQLCLLLELNYRTGRYSKK